MDRDLRTCTKHFPTQKSEQTSAIEDSFPIYRRRCLHLVTKPTKGGDIVLDDTWVVPYNPYLCKKYNAHINVKFAIRYCQSSICTNMSIRGMIKHL